MHGALKLRELLASRQLSLNRLSQRTAELFGSASPCHIPHNLYSDLERRGAIPSLWQMFALSTVTGYRLTDWIAVFGLQIDSILGLQFGISRKHTSLLDTTVYDDQAWLTPLVERQPGLRRSQFGPLLQIARPGPPIRAREIVALNHQRFRYARIGDQDSYAAPEFLEGTIIRVDPRRTTAPPYSARHDDKKEFYLIEQDSGWNCASVYSLGRDRVLLECGWCPWLTRELRVGADVQILGAVDAEIRRLGRFGSPVPGASPRRPQAPIKEPATLGDLLRRGRIRQGLSFREASALSESLAKRQSDPLYFASPSTLSDCETLTAAPRQIQRSLMLCILYSIRFDEFLSFSALPIAQSGTEPIPDEFVGRHKPKAKGAFAIAPEHVTDRPDRGLSSLFKSWEEVPVFLRHALDELSGIHGCSPRDIFIVGEAQSFTDPLLRGTQVLAVARRARRPPAARTTKPENCHVYVLLDRNGRYVCGRCALEGHDYVLYSSPQTGIEARRYRAEIEAEVIGRVTSIARQLP